MQRHATFTGKYRGQRPRHSFSSQICHPTPQLRWQGRLCSPPLARAQGLRGHFAPQPTGTPCRHQLQAPTPGLPRMVDGGEVSSAPPPLLPRRGEPVELR